MDRPLTGRMRSDRHPVSLEEYRRAGGYRGLERAVKEMSPQEVVEVVKQANLRGRGGAGFPAGLKWASMRNDDDAPHPRYMIANADEMEPGAFKDRLLMERDPHQLIEGLIIAAYAVRADVAYIFLRFAYQPSAQHLKRAIDEAEQAGLLGRNILGSGFSLEMFVHSSAGRYLCGEGTALLNALEGRRAIPRVKPPRSTTAGLWGMPTVVNNVETLCNVPHILTHGAQWFLDLSAAKEGKHGKDGGTKLFGVSGRVKRPGAWELPMGISIGELLHEHAGGMREGRRFRGLLPGGASTGFLVEQHMDVAMDFDSVQAAGSRLGTGTMIIADDQVCPVGMLKNLEHFFARESCGWCTPCREGLPWTEQLLAEIEAGRGRPEDLEQLQFHIRMMGMGKTFCAHAPGAMMPLETGLKYFEEDFQQHIREQRCPYRGEGNHGH